MAGCVVQPELAVVTSKANVCPPVMATERAPLSKKLADAPFVIVMFARLLGMFKSRNDITIDVVQPSAGVCTQIVNRTNV